MIIFSCHSKKEFYENYSVPDSNYTEKIKIINEEKITFKNETFNPNIKTVLCHKKEEQISLAIINLGSEDKLLISFDDLDADKKNYFYTIIHCNADWTKSNLMKNEYINGFYEEAIHNYEFSFNTIQQYTHYQFEFPTKNVEPILSGNYIFKIYDENKNTIIYKRFMILERRIHIDANVRRATLAKYRTTKHEIDFTIIHPNLRIADPFSNIKVHIKQNNRMDNAITDLTPQFVMNDKLDYNYEDENTFWGNNEFRNFDFRSLRYHSEKIKDIDFDSIYNHVYLFKDKARPFDLYSIDPDRNGDFIIASQEGTKASLEADYAFVHFTLPINKINYGDLYILGKFSDWEIKDDFKLKYNIKKKQYEGNIYLKQGTYDYHYALDDTTTNRIDIRFIEGTHYQTRNDYYIYVYYRFPSDRHDRFIGFLKTSSKELF